MREETMFPVFAARRLTVKTIERRGPGITGSGRCARDRSTESGRNVTFTAIASVAASLLVMLMLLSAISGPALASVEKGDGGTKFSYSDPEAGAVFLAGTFNGWNATSHPMEKLKSGTWVLTVELGPGTHDYKFVVDGAWITDFENPSSAPDPYGGVNSIVTLDNEGNILVDEGSEEKKIANTAYSPRVNFNGFFLFRAPIYKNFDDDARWRMFRPEYGFDLNSIVTINEQVEGYARLRVDSPSNLANVNAVAAWLNEAHIKITPPGIMDLNGYYNMEVLWSEDPLTVFGDEDLEGTIFDDHLKIGKGTAGVVFNSDWPKFEFRSFAANTYDEDIYNDPDLYDNTGTDRVTLRGARRFGWIKPGINYFLEQNIWWLDMTDRIGSTPSNTGIPRLDEYIDSSGDPSDWYEFQGKTWFAGIDAYFYFLDDKFVPAIQYMRGEAGQGFVTSNSSGLDFENGPIDVPIAKRDATIYHVELPYRGIENLYLNAEYNRRELLGVDSDESLIMPTFLPNDEANKQIYFEVDQNPPAYTRDYGEFEARWTKDGLDARLWIEREMEKYDRSDEDLSAYQYRLSVSPGVKLTLWDVFDFGFEGQFSNLDGSKEFDVDGNTYQGIFRGAWWLTSKFAFMCDVRIINYSLDETDTHGDFSDTFYNPFIGIEYRFLDKVNVVFAYGVDPVSFGRDYGGRQTGRWNFRQAYMWENPDATIVDAENALNDVQAFTLRATFRF
jgi:hypothetical protein